MTEFVFSTTHSFAPVSLPSGTRTYYSLETAAYLVGVHPDLVLYYCRLGIFGTERARRDRAPTFDDEALYTLRKVEHYRRRHGVNRQALPLLFALHREVERLESELRFLRGP